ncbi:Uncharacterised protein [Bordetella pertussis]|nr:Uncharacterised protein [Bordetella pertussis]
MLSVARASDQASSMSSVWSSAVTARARST